MCNCKTDKVEQEKQRNFLTQSNFFLKRMSQPREKGLPHSRGQTGNKVEKIAFESGNEQANHRPRKAVRH
jgi:hypothetical protein